MTTLQVALAEIAALKARVDALEAARGGAPAPASGGSAPAAEALPDHLLEKSWANKAITKDPKKWKNASRVGRKYSRAPVEWLELMAEHYEFKAQKGREEVPVRTRNDGKPWHESDTFEAKLLRAWAKRNANKSTSKPKPSAPKDDFGGDDFGGPAPPADDGGFGGGGDDEIPFILDATIYGRWDRP